MDDHHDNDQHVEDDDPTVLQPEAARVLLQVVVVEAVVLVEAMVMSLAIVVQII